MENVSIYRLKCLTNMHVGDGEVNYNIIDNEVQKDIVLGVPTIHSSGVKGALRSYVHNKKNDDIDEDYIFGAQGKETSQGAYKFFSANMIARPLRVSDGTEAYVLATSVDIINTQLNFLKSLGVWSGEGLGEELKNQYLCSSDLKGYVKEVEGMKVSYANARVPVLESLIGKNWLLVPHDMLCRLDLPVQARNVLENGKSQNLWYEEVVPHESIFFMAVLTDGIEDELYNFIQAQGGVVQFGADASIGYGFCKVDKWEKAGMHCE